MTSASNPTDKRNKPVCHLFYRVGIKTLKKVEVVQMTVTIMVVQMMVGTTMAGLIMVVVVMMVGC